MTYIFRGKNPFRFPAKDDILNYEIEDIIAVNRPTRSQQYFETNETQFAGLQQKQWMLWYFTVLNLFLEHVVALIAFSLLKWVT